MNNLNLLFTLVGLIYTPVFALEVSALFTDNMVLQQNTLVKIWGKSFPQIKINIEASWGEKATAISGKNGKWICDIKTPSAGGPYTLSIADKNSLIKIDNVLIGEVWFCSGQSNMEMPVQGWPPNDLIQNSEQEIEEANYPGIRMFTVARHASLLLQDDVIGSWRECNPQNVKAFSATAYFFARKLYKELNVPIGLVHSSWGGTPAQAWMDKKHLQNYPEFKATTELIDKSQEKIAIQKNWLANLEQLILDEADNVNRFEELDLKDKGVEKDNFDDAEWKTMQLPRLWETSALGEFDGVVWFRKKVDLSSFHDNKNLIIELGPIDDMDITFFNGNEIGRHMKEGFWNKKRVYKIPANLIKKGINTIAVKVIDNQGGGGLYGVPEDLKIYVAGDSEKNISLAGDWKYLPTAEYKNARFYLFNIQNQQYYQRPKVPVESNPQNPTTLYNGMVYPVVPFTIKGVIWYQGEDNTPNPEQYEELFPDLIQNWRNIWGLGSFPFYFTQIAPYQYEEDRQSFKLRDAQRKSLKVENSGMAVTLDIGNPQNIHPANKQDVGLRLALWALAKTYNKDVVFSGPLYESMEVKGNTVVISFNYSGKGLKAKDDVLKKFLIAGNDKIFKDATALIDGNKLVISHPDIENPEAVRYLWDNTSAATLFNLDGLPASSFRTDNW